MRPALTSNSLFSRVCAIFSLTLGALGCGSLSSYTAPPDDYSAYRSTRLGQSFEARLTAASTYLERYPGGVFEADVRRYFEQAEPVFYGAKNGSVAGLESYLRTLPKGPHSEEALAQLRKLRNQRSDEEQMRGVVELGARLSLRSMQRARVRGEIEDWTRRFLDAPVWSRPLIQAPDELIVAWRLALPQPVCGEAEAGGPPEYARRCSKLMELPYTVASDEGPLDLQATIEIVLIQDTQGKPVFVSIGGPDLFLRVEETFKGRAIPLEDKASRLSGASRIVEIAKRAFGRYVSEEAACKSQARAPFILNLGCQGWSLKVRAGSEGEDDLIQIERELAK